MFDPEYEVRVARQKMAADQRNAAAFRLAREGGVPNAAVRLYDSAVIRVSRGPRRRQEARSHSRLNSWLS
jgi:hypothetical protein